MSKKNKTMPQEKQKNDIQIEKTMTDIDKEIYMPKKLIYSELPDDSPKELDELFRFYYKTIYNLPEIKTDKEFNEYIKKIPAAKRSQLIYLDFLAQQAIPLYYIEYKMLVSTRITYISSGRQNSILQIPKQYWDERTGRYEFSFSRFIRAIKKITKEEFVSKTLHNSSDGFSEKNNEKKFELLLNTFDRTFVKGIVLNKKCLVRKVIRRNNEQEKLFYEPTCVITIKVVDSIINEFKEKEIVIKILYGVDQKENKFNNFDRTKKIEIGKEYFIIVGSNMRTNNRKEYLDKVTIGDKTINDHLYYYTPYQTFYPLNEKDKIIFDKNLVPLRNNIKSYNEFKNRIKKEINFLKNIENGSLK